MRRYFILFLKGMAMGIANVIPGVSGGTIALITRIYEKLINSLKSFDKNALELLISLKIRKFVSYVNLDFLFAVFIGSIISVFSIANLFKYLFEEHPILIWALFFGLILASIYYVGKRITEWNKINIIILLCAALLTFGISMIEPANENDNLFFVFICGIIGISGMLLPGLSGSFILILLGNYELLMVNAIANLDYILLITFILGSIAGLFGFSHIISWLLKKHKNKMLSLLTGFILGSLYVIWPWKEKENTEIINGVEKTLSYNCYIPQELNTETLFAIGLIIAGSLIVVALESFSKID